MDKTKKGVKNKMNNICELYCFKSKKKATEFIGSFKNWELIWSINKKKWIALKFNHGKGINNG